MAARRVRKTGKDGDGDITRLCHDGQTWSPRSKSDAVSDINGGRHTYFVDEAGFRSEIYVTEDGHLQTRADASSQNNLDNLPDC